MDVGQTKNLSWVERMDRVYTCRSVAIESNYYFQC